MHEASSLTSISRTEMAGMLRRSERGDGAHRGGSNRGGVLTGVGWYVPGLASQVAADGGPTVTTVGGLPDAGGRVEEHVGILRRPVQRLRAHGARGRLRGRCRST